VICCKYNVRCCLRRFCHVIRGPPPSKRQHQSGGDCLKIRRENNQNCSMLCYVWHLWTVIHMWTVLQFVHWFRFRFRFCVFVLFEHYMCCYVSLYQFIPVLLVFVVLALVYLVPSLEIGWEERLRNDLSCVQWDVKPRLNQSHDNVAWQNCMTKLQMWCQFCNICMNHVSMELIVYHVWKLLWHGVLLTLIIWAGHVCTITY